MFKKIIGIILAIFITLVIILSVKEGIEGKPEAILNKLIQKSYLEIQEVSRPKDFIFKEGQGLNFLVKYMWIIPVGNANIEVKEPLTYQGRKAYRFLAIAETSSFFSKFFKASASIESYMDAKNLYSIRYKEETHIPDHEPEIKDITYDQKNLVMELKGVKRKILPDTQDPLSALFYIRTQEFEPGKTFVINTITKEENYELKAEVLRKEVVKTSAGEVEAWVVDSTVRRWDRSSYHGAAFTIWFVGKSKLPILVKARTKAGPVTARLVSVRNHL